MCTAELDERFQALEKGSVCFIRSVGRMLLRTTCSLFFSYIVDRSIEPAVLSTGTQTRPAEEEEEEDKQVSVLSSSSSVLLNQLHTLCYATVLV